MTKKKTIPEDCMPRCGSCAFFVADAKDELGECRRLPPYVLPDGDDGVGFSFAVTVVDYWCGEFKRKLSS